MKRPQGPEYGCFFYLGPTQTEQEKKKSKCFQVFDRRKGEF